MAAGSRNPEAADLVTSLSSAVLGDLDYDDDGQAWVLELGYVVAQYEYLLNNHQRDQKSQARLDDLIIHINKISGRNLEGITIQRELQIGECVTKVRRFVKALRPKDYALFLIACCSWYIAKNSEFIGGSDPKHDIQLKKAAEDHLSELETGCRDIVINRHTLLGKLNQNLSQSGNTHELRKLLQELCRPIKVLLISADPKDTSPARSEQERRALVKAVREADYRHRVIVEHVHGCHGDDIHNSLNDHIPNILQFLGHGDTAGLYFEGRDNEANPVFMRAFADVLQQYETIKLVILNTCNSQSEGQCIADAVGSCIGMEGTIRNSDAIAFSKEFYTAFGGGHDIKDSFDHAKVHVKLDPAARFQAHLLRRGLPPHPAKSLTQRPLGSGKSEYRGLDMSTSKLPFTCILILIFCLMGMAVYFQNVCIPADKTTTLGQGLWNSSIRLNSSSLVLFKEPTF